jgi:cytochrome P450
MRLASEMDLPVLPVEDPGFPADPMPHVDAARRQHPWLARFHAGYVIHGHQATKDLLALDDHMRPFFDGVVEIFEGQGTEWGRFMTEILPTQSGPNHARLRSVVAEAFTPRRAHNTRPLMRQVISGLLDEWTPRGEFDFAEFASFFPITVMCALVGVSAEAVSELHEALENQVAVMSLNKELLPKLIVGHEVMWNFAGKAVQDAEERLKGTDDGSLMAALIATRDSGAISDRELRHLLMVLLLGGFDTTKNMLTLTVRTIMEMPEIWARCGQDQVYCGKVVEEMLRHSTILTPYRVITKDVDYDGVRIPQGTMVCFALPLSGRDPAAFPDPMRFDPERTYTNRHFAFGRGAHVCIGQHLARVQIEEGLHQIAQRLALPRLVGEIAYRPFLGAGGLRTLPIAFDLNPVEPAAA